MPNSSTNPSWIDPPPPPPAGMGCLPKGCLVLVVLTLLFVVGVYFFVSHGLVTPTPAQLPVEELAPEALSAVHQRIEQFQNAPPVAASPSPTESVAPDATPIPETAPTPPGRELILTAGEINGLIAANPKSRGHAHVSLSGQSANVQISIPSNKVPGFPDGYLNGTFVITTDGPTSLGSIQVSKIRANGYPVPSGILSMTYRGQSILDYALSGVAPYNVGTAEIRDGNVVLH